MTTPEKTPSTNTASSQEKAMEIAQAINGWYDIGTGPDAYGHNDFIPVDDLEKVAAIIRPLLSPAAQPANEVLGKIVALRFRYLTDDAFGGTSYINGIGAILANARIIDSTPAPAPAMDAGLPSATDVLTWMATSIGGDDEAAVKKFYDWLRRRPAPTASAPSQPQTQAQPSDHSGATGNAVTAAEWENRAKIWKVAWNGERKACNKVAAELIAVERERDALRDVAEDVLAVSEWQDPSRETGLSWDERFATTVEMARAALAASAESQNKTAEGQKSAP
jgi:hypothetical protein